MKVWIKSGDRPNNQLAEVKDFSGKHRKLHVEYCGDAEPAWVDYAHVVGIEFEKEGESLSIMFDTKGSRSSN